MIQRVKKVKEWIDSNDNQFEVVQFYETPPDQIKLVVRLSDGIPFLRFAPWDYGDGPFDGFYIMDFMPDMKTVKYEIQLEEKRISGLCEINDIQLCEENKGKVICIGKKIKK